MPVDPSRLPSLTDALQLVQNYDQDINALWTLYIGAVSAVVALLNSKNFRVPTILLAALFSLFAIGNLYGLTKVFNAKGHLIDYASGIAPAGPLSLLFVTARPASLTSLWMQHLTLDVAVLAVVAYYSRRARTVRA